SQHPLEVGRAGHPSRSRPLTRVNPTSKGHLTPRAGGSVHRTYVPPLAPSPSGSYSPAVLVYLNPSERLYLHPWEGSGVPKLGGPQGFGVPFPSGPPQSRTRRRPDDDTPPDGCPALRGAPLLLCAVVQARSRPPGRHPRHVHHRTALRVDQPLRRLVPRRRCRGLR